MKARLTILGSRAGEPGTWGATAGYLVTYQSTRILLDCGFGIPQLLVSRECLASLNAVIVSHLHADHVAGLLTLAYMYQLQELIEKHLIILLPPGGIEFIKKWQALFAMESFPALRAPFTDAFELQEYEKGAFSLLNVSITLLPLKHAVTNYGVRLCGDSWSLTYTGDTGCCPEIIRLVDGSGFFLCEATYLKEREEILIGHGHLTGTLAGKIARDASAKHLILTHFSQSSSGWLASLRRDALASFGAPVDLALPGAEFALED